MSEFFRDIVKELKDENTSIAADANASAEYSGSIDTGSYILNALLSGSIYGGVPNNKITALAGESATGKTFFALGIIQQFLNDNKDAAVFYFDTEAAVTKNMMTSRGIDANRVIISEPQSIQDFRTIALRVLENYEKAKEKDRPPMMMVLDSLGQLSSTKELEDSADGKETRDMTKAQLLKATFRVLGLRLARAGVPLIVTNHVYDAVGSMFPTKNMSGGSGLKYSASTIVFLSKRKDKEGTEVVGNYIGCTLNKSRFTKENTKVHVKLSYEDGLDRYYGLVDLAVKYGIFEKVSTRIQLPDGTKTFEKSIYREPEKYFTEDVLKQLDEACQTEFLYGKVSENDDREDDTEELM